MSEQIDNAARPVRKRRWPLAAFLFVAVLMGAASFIYFRPAVPEDTSPEISFESYSEQEGSFEGVFAVRNPHRRPIQIQYLGAESQYHGEWPETYEFPFFAGIIYGEELAPGETKLISVHSPPKSDIWRVPFWWEFGITTTEKLKLMISQNWQAFRNGQPLPGRQIVQIPKAYLIGSFPYSITYSPVITNSTLLRASSESNSQRDLGKVDLLRR